MNEPSPIETIDTLLNEDTEFKKFYNLKRNLMSYFEVDKIFEMIKDKVTESDLVDFTSPRQARHISTKQPVFKLVMDDEKTFSKYPNRDSLADLYTNSEKLYSFRLNALYEEVISPCGREMFDQFSSLMKNNDIKESTYNLLKEEPSVEQLQDIFMINMFKVYIEDTTKNTPIANIEYLW